MKKIFSLLILCLLVQTTWSQSGEGYDPENPADPDAFYTLTLEASPQSGGTVGSNSRLKLTAGETTNLNATPRLGYEFKRWMVGDSIVSTDSSISFTMPAKDVVLTAYFEWSPEYNPQNPGDPDAEGYSHRVYVYASPSVGGYFNSSSFMLVEGKATNIYAYPREGYRFESWMCNGEVVSTDNPLSIKMGTSDIAYTATFVYNPVSPDEPSPNVFNAATGEVIIDNFTPGSLNNAIYTAVGSSDNYALVQSILVIGRMQSSDFGFARSYRNCSLIDLSRTTGYTEVPVWSFDGAEALTKLILPASVEHIGNNAFNGCKNLSELYCYATTPPEVSENAFSGVESALVVKVPASAVPLYQKADGWKNFTILPIDEETCSIIINLPVDAGDGRYRNMYIELENAISGQSYKYLITDRTSYTFANLIRNTSYNIRVKNAVGAILGEKEKVMLGEEDLTIEFESLRQPQTLTAKVLAPEGLDITSQATITWLNEDGSLLANGAKVSGVLEGTHVIYRIALPQALAMQYKMPSDVAWIVKPSDNNITCQLQTLEEVALSGRILDVTSEKPIANATITISQLLNGKYTKSSTARTNNEGRFAINVFDAQSSMSVSANNYLSQTSEYADFSSEQQLGDILLKAITGAVITVGFTYTESVEDGQATEEQSWYSDEANVIYSLYNQTKNKAIEEFNTQNGSIVLLEEVAEGDVLRMTAKSKTGMFRDVTVTATVDDHNHASVIFPIVALGGLKAYTESENNGVVGILYDANGVLLRKSSFNGDTLTVSNLADGNYTLVTMGSSNFFNSVLHLSELANAGLAEGRDFVKNTLTVSSGHITKLNIGSVPTLDESQFYYTGENTSFSVNKSQVTIGNYITLRAKVDFKDEYATSIRDLKLIVDLPESCSFVDNSVLTGNGMAGYEYAGNRVIVNMNKQNDVVRFCVIPTIGGTCKPSAFVQFNYNGETIMQPIGSAYFNAQNLAISVPTQTADSVVVVNGTAQADCIVKVYDGDVLVGQTRSLANGRWSARVNLYKPYSHSFHYIYAEVGTANGQTLLTDTKLVEFDKTMTQLKTITMLYNGNTIVFDQIEGTTSTNTYSYVPSVTDFTFIAQFTKNDTTLIKNLEFKILASDGTVRHVPSTFSSRLNAWVGKSTYDNSSRIPANVSAAYYLSRPIGQIDTMRIHSDWVEFKEMILSNVANIDPDKSKILESADSKIIYLYQTTNMESPVYMKIEEVVYSDWIDELNKRDYIVVEKDGKITYMVDSIMESNYISWFWTEDARMLMIEFSYNLSFSGEKIRKKSPRRASTWWGNIIDGFCPLNICGIMDIIGQYNRGNEEYQHWLCQYNVTLNEHYALYLKTKGLLNARCKDGSLKLHPSIYDLFCDFLSYDYERANWMHQDFKRNLDTMERNLVERRNLASALSALMSIPNILGANAVTNLISYLSFALTGTATNFAGWGVDRFLNYLEDWFTDDKMKAWFYPANKEVVDGYVHTQNNIVKAYTKCEEEDEEEEEEYNTPPLKPSTDPSGYVYEGVSSNRLQGVTATAYYMETTEDMYGVLHDEPKVWDAEEYAQENPLFTDENGMYQWDVPQGLWQVKFEKEGYETTYSEWLPVPPPQLEVNIGMVQSRQPDVIKAHAYKDGIEVEFDKYMLPSLLNTENILVSQNGEYVEGDVKLQNEETAYDDESVKYASKIRFVPKNPFTAKEVTLIVANRVKSYAGLQMQDSYQQAFDIEEEIKDIIVDESISVPYEGTKTIIVQVVPASAAAGKTMYAVSTSDMIASIQEHEVTIDQLGQAQFTLNGELMGATAITFSIEGYDIQKTMNVTVENMEQPTVPMPQPSIASGSSVYDDTALELSVEGEGLKIWYTTDGSCPCDENGTRKCYESPIHIRENVIIKAMAENKDGEVSEIATFVYQILQSTNGMMLGQGWNWVSFNMESASLSSVNSALSTGVWASGDEIKNGMYVDAYSEQQGKWLGTLSNHGQLNAQSMYMIHSSSGQTLSLQGKAVNPEKSPVTVHPAWNYLPYLPLLQMDVSDALANYSAETGDVIKSQDAFAVYTDQGWQGDLTVLEPGAGYMLKRAANASEVSFQYPKRLPHERKNKSRVIRHHHYAHNMNVVGHVTGISLCEGDSLVAMADGEVRGQCAIDGKGQVFLTLDGDKRESVTLYVQRDGHAIASAKQTIQYENDAVMGTPDFPSVIDFGDSGLVLGIQVTPKVVTDELTITVNDPSVEDIQISIYQSDGRKVISVGRLDVHGGYFTKTISVAHLPVGIYLVEVVHNNQPYVTRIHKR